MTITLTNRGLADAFAGRLALVGVSLPLATNGHRPGAIFDPTGKPVLLVGAGYGRHERENIARLIVEAVNATGGIGS